MYLKHNWVNNSAPYLNSKNLNEMEDGIEGVYHNLIGFISYYCKETPPDGWLVCDGSEIDREKYKLLYDVVGTTFGSGDGSTTFNLPDLRGEFIRGYSNGSDVDKGRTFGSKQEGTTFTVHDRNFGAETIGGGYDVLSTGLKGSPSGGGGSSFDTSSILAIRPRNIALLPCIFTGVTAI